VVVKAVSISVQNALAITTTTLPEASVLDSYNFCLSTANGIGDRVFSVTANQTPPGTVLQMNGCFTNAPTTTGTFPFTVTVTDSASPPEVATQDFVIRASAKDQSAFASNGAAIAFGGPDGRRLAQTITAAANGTLTAFGLTQQTRCDSLDSTAILSVQVQRLSAAGLPDGTTIASGRSDTGWDGIAIAPSVPVAVGMRLAFIISSATACTLIDGSSNDFYQGGDAYVDTNNTWTPLLASDGRYDIPFRMLIQPAQPVTPLSRYRGGHTATVLKSGIVLLAGSDADAELYDPAHHTSTLTGTMNVRRYTAAAARLNDGTVLIAGGSLNGVPYNTAELYEPASGRFTPTGSNLSAPRDTAAATLLADGRVLIAGGWSGTANLKTADIYDPATRTFATFSMTTARNVPTATVLLNGTVLIAGGFSDGSPTGHSAEIFDPTTNTFTPTAGEMIQWRGWAAAVLLADGRVLITGGLSGDAMNEAEIYDPATGRFTITGAMSQPRQQHTATRLADGSVLIAGGLAEVGFNNYTLGLATAERWVPALNTFVPAGGLEARRNAHTAVLMSDNTVLLAGGFGDSWMSGATAELYTPAIPVLTATQLADGQKDAPYPKTVLSATGGAGAPFEIDLIASVLPPGMTFDVASATLSGTPTAVGTYTLGMRVRDVVGQVNFQSLTLSINPVVVTSPYRLPDATAAQHYSTQLTASSQATWSVPDPSALPAGLSIDASGLISGTPSAIGYYNFVVRAVNSAGQSAMKVVAIGVNSPSPGGDDGTNERER
jgi:hypothetical protein